MGYWRLKPILDKKSLMDSSVNPQIKTQAGELKFEYDDTYPVRCVRGQLWNDALSYCQSDSVYEETVFKVNTNNQNLITVNYGITGNQYNLEFWFKTDPGRPDCEVFTSTDVKAIV